MWIRAQDGGLINLAMAEEVYAWPNSSAREWHEVIARFSDADENFASTTVVAQCESKEQAQALVDAIHNALAGHVLPVAMPPRPAAKLDTELAAVKAKNDQIPF